MEQGYLSPRETSNLMIQEIQTQGRNLADSGEVDKNSEWISRVDTFIFRGKLSEQGREVQT